jgi:hypothetical protein
MALSSGRSMSPIGADEVPAARTCTVTMTGTALYPGSLEDTSTVAEYVPGATTRLESETVMVRPSGCSAATTRSDVDVTETGGRSPGAPVTRIVCTGVCAVLPTFANVSVVRLSVSGITLMRWTSRRSAVSNGVSRT